MKRNEAFNPERELEVHPLADIFPMMPDEELQELAVRIKENGLRHPIVTDASGSMIIDGRNRLAACKIAGVTPTFEAYTGDDPRAYIVDANLARRSVSKSQHAMAMAIAYPNAEHGGKRDKGSSLVSKLEFSKTRLSQARTVLRYSLPLAKEVMAGTTPLDEAIETVRLHDVKANSKETHLKTLRVHAPDLADAVIEERLTVTGALAELGERNAMKERIRQSGRVALKELDLLNGTVDSIAHAIALGEDLINPAVVEKAERACTSLRKLLEREK